MKTQGRPTDTAIARTDPNAELQALKSWITDPKQLAKLTEYGRGFMDAKTMSRVLIMSCSKSPDLLRCTRQSMLRALAESAAVKVKPGGIMGRGYLVPRKNTKLSQQAGQPVYEMSFDPGWRGLIDIARRSGDVLDIDAALVYAEEVATGRFIYERGTEPKLVHKPIFDGTNKGRVVGAYAVATFRNGSKHAEFLTIEDVNKRRNVSQMRSDSGPWAQWPEEMIKKTVVRYLCKYLPFSDELDQAMRMADKSEGVLDAEYEVLEDTAEEEPIAEPAETPTVPTAPSEPVV